ncbi:MAG: hypothetical protein Ta2F_08890 [Termitinemataceae bacterium]|nr:MAG: hypothetical protein Ta2F_08890 [Termitinemataceae bacterium]
MTAFSYLADHIPVRKDLKFRIEDNIGIVCNANDFRVDFLNETATTVFQLIDGKKNVSDIVQCFLEKVDVSRDVFEQDLIEILRNFQWQKLIAMKQNL